MIYPMTRPARLALTAVALIVWAASLSAQSFETRARAAWVYDQTTQTVLMTKNSDEPLPPASMSKLMTIYLAFEAIASGRLNADEPLPVSEHAAAYDGSSMFLDPRDRPTVEDVLRGIIVLSGNDASAVMAEALSPDGTEAGFARLMNERAPQIGLTASHFVNSNGWPAEGHVMSVHDLGILADRIIRDYPTFYPLFSEQEFLFDGRVPSNTQNRNPILGLGIGADGLKTGHTAEAGYGLVGSAKQGDRRVIFVVSGLSSQAERAEESERIVNWAFRQFALREVATSGTQIAQAPVWMGEAEHVGLTVAEDVSLLLPASLTGGVTAEVRYTGPIEAPIDEGQRLGELVITAEGLPETRVDLVADRAVARGGILVRLKTAAALLISKVAPADTAAPT